MINNHKISRYAVLCSQLFHIEIQKYINLHKSYPIKKQYHFQYHSSKIPLWDPKTQFHKTTQKYSNHAQSRPNSASNITVHKFHYHGSQIPLSRFMNSTITVQSRTEFYNNTNHGHSIYQNPHLHISF